MSEIHHYIIVLLQKAFVKTVLTDENIFRHLTGGLSGVDGKFARQASWICLQDALQTFPSKVRQNCLNSEMFCIAFALKLANEAKLNCKT